MKDAALNLAATWSRRALDELDISNAAMTDAEREVAARSARLLRKCAQELVQIIKHNIDPTAPTTKITRR